MRTKVFIFVISNINLQEEEEDEGEEGKEERRVR